MYSLPEITAITQSLDPLVLKQFIGNAEIGWKVAYSDRLMAWYGSFWIASLVYAVIRRRVKPLPFWGLILFSLPMFVDGTTHTHQRCADQQPIWHGFPRCESVAGAVDEQRAAAVVRRR